MDAAVEADDEEVLEELEEELEEEDPSGPLLVPVPTPLRSQAESRGNIEDPTVFRVIDFHDFKNFGGFPRCPEDMNLCKKISNPLIEMIHLSFVFHTDILEGIKLVQVGPASPIRTIQWGSFIIYVDF